MNKKLLSLLIVGAIVWLAFYINAFNKPVPENDKVIKDDENDKEEVEIDEAEDRIETIKMVSVGDFIYHYYQIVPVPSQPSGYDYHDNLQYTKPYFQDADITTGNYETTTTTTREYASYPQFNTPVESLDAIRDAGFDLVSTIHNHTLDSGKQGVIDTYNAIVDRDIIPVGTRLKEEPSIQNIERKGIKIGFLAYTYGYNGLDGVLSEADHKLMLSPMDEEIIEAEIKDSVESDNDLTVVIAHWGDEYQPKPSQTQRDLAQKMVDWGADIILGSHPHVVQEHEMIGDAFVIYSMGNFISDQRLETLDNIDTERGLMLEFTIQKDFNTNETTIEKVDFHPLWVNKYFKEDNYYYETIVAKDYIDGKIDPYVPEGSESRIQSAYDETMSRVNGIN